MKKYLLSFLMSVVSLCACDTLGNVDDRMEEIAGEYVLTAAYDYSSAILNAFPPATISKVGDRWMFECTMPQSYAPATRYENVITESVQTVIEWNEAAGQYLFNESSSSDDYYHFVYNAEKNRVTYGSIVWRKK